MSNANMNTIVSQAIVQQASDFETKLQSQLHASNLFHIQRYSLLQEHLREYNIFHAQRHSDLQKQIDELTSKIADNTYKLSKMKA